MTKTEQEKRAMSKTQAGQLQQKLESDFHLAPRIAQAVVSEAEACLGMETTARVAGQRLAILANRQASHAQAMGQTAMQQVYWTVDAGSTDAAILAEHGKSALRQVRIQRMVDEAIEQGALASQEDLAIALEVDVRTIKRDCQALQATGAYLPLRGRVRNIGRGQSHKSQIIKRWLHGETYDQLTQSTHHHISCIARYVQSFVRMVVLCQEGMSESQIAHLTQSSVKLVQEYLTLYREQDEPSCRERLQEQIERLQGSGGAQQTQKKRLS